MKASTSGMMPGNSVAKRCDKHPATMIFWRSRSGSVLASVHRAEDGVDGFLLGHVDERAGVDDEDVGEFRIGRERHAGLREVADHDFGVDQVFGAAKRDETYGCHGVDAEMLKS
jgi:hypothetical protein